MATAPLLSGVTRATSASFIFFDPELGLLFRDPVSGHDAAPITLWELGEIRNKLSRQGESAIHEDLIFDAYQRLRDIEEHAKASTRNVRRKKEITSVIPAERGEQAMASNAQAPDFEEDPSSFQPFDELEILP